MEDPMDEPAESLPRVCLAKPVVCSEVQCSKIIHQRATHRTRFQQQDTAWRIVKYSHPLCEGANDAGEFPRPTCSPLPCFNCHYRFDGPPVFLPLISLHDVREEWGNFCTAACANRYLHMNMNDCNLAARAADLYEYMREVHGLDTQQPIGMAPHFSQRQLYGGELSDQDFRLLLETPTLTTRLLMRPFIPTQVVVEMTYSAPASAGAGAGAGAAAAAAAQPPQQPSGQPEEDAEPAEAAATPAPATSVAAAPMDPLDAVMHTKPPDVEHHHRWGVRGLRQKSLAEIEVNLAQLPPQEVREGSYLPYKLRKEREAAEAAAAAAAEAENPCRPVAVPGSTAPPSKKRPLAASAAGSAAGAAGTSAAAFAAGSASSPGAVSEGGPQVRVPAGAGGLAGLMHAPSAARARGAGASAAPKRQRTMDPTAGR
jgi:hypothetical protein